MEKKITALEISSDEDWVQVEFGSYSPSDLQIESSENQHVAIVSPLDAPYAQIEAEKCVENAELCDSNQEEFEIECSADVVEEATHQLQVVEENNITSVPADTVEKATESRISESTMWTRIHNRDSLLLSSIIIGASILAFVAARSSKK